jgi:hypothetical protein
MEIHRSKARQRKQPFRKDFPVRHDDKEVWGQRLEESASRIIAEGEGLMDRQTKLESFGFHRGRRKRLASPRRTIRLRDNPCDRVAAFIRKTLKYRDRK